MFVSSFFGQERSRSRTLKTIVLRRWILLEGYRLCRRPFPGDPEHESADFTASPSMAVAGKLAGGLGGWVTGWPAGWPAGWLAWLAGWLAG